MAQRKNVRKASTKSTKSTLAAVVAAEAPPVSVVEVSSTPVRNTPVPKAAIPTLSAPKPAEKAITHEMIATRAYEISISGCGGSESDNWFRAECELRAA